MSCTRPRRCVVVMRLHTRIATTSSAPVRLKRSIRTPRHTTQKGKTPITKDEGIVIMISTPKRSSSNAWNFLAYRLPFLRVYGFDCLAGWSFFSHSPRRRKCTTIMRLTGVAYAVVYSPSSTLHQISALTVPLFLFCRRPSLSR